jgi:hypothetical protein
VTASPASNTGHPAEDGGLAGHDEASGLSETTSRGDPGGPIPRRARQRARRWRPRRA